MQADTLTSAAATLVADLEQGLTVRVHPPPVPVRPVAGPCVLVGVPMVRTQTPTPAGCGPVWDVSIEVLVISSDVTGADLLAHTDAVLGRLATTRWLVDSTSPVPYDVPGMPAPLPAVQITLE